ncbi:MAG: DUF1707 domain-containing protein [Gemmatimonadota bacterium]
MSDQPSPPTLASLREQTIDVLCKHFAEDRLSMSELERRLDRATAARTRRELAALLSDLQGPSGAPAPVSSGEETSPARKTAGRSPRDVRDEGDRANARRPARRRRAPITDEDRRAAADSVVVAILGGSRKVGRWRPPPHLHAVAFWGGVVLDLRDAILPEGRFEVSAFAVMGGVDIIVPPDLPVETNGIALLGGFDQAAETAYGDDDEGGPRLVVSGFALMGGVSVKLRAPDERRTSRHDTGRHLSREERRLALEERRLERHARRLDRQAQRLEDRRRDLDGE